MVNENGNIIYVENKLLNGDFWESNPKNIEKTIRKIAIKNEKNELTFICQKYLSLTNETRCIDKIYEKNNNYLLVLGKVLNNDGSMKKTLLDRLKCALDLFNKDPSIKILTSGKGLKFGISEAETMKIWLIENGVPQSSVILESNSSDTMENIIYSMDILNNKKASEVTLITSEDHLYRSYSLACIYKENKNLNFTLNRVSSKKYKIDGYFSENKENFILFKDIGRILNLWDYQNNILPESTPLTNRANKLRI